MTANVLAAAALARAGTVPPSAIRAAVQGFRADHHRTELVATSDGVTWVDDSKATNPHAATASLSAYEHVVWVVGGLFKGVDVDDLVARFGPAVRAVVVIGTDRSPVLDAFARHAPTVPVLQVETTDTDRVMPEAVRHAATVARPGDTVLLAPAAASFDQFGSYADRGERFAAAVHEHLGGNADGDTDGLPGERP